MAAPGMANGMRSFTLIDGFRSALARPDQHVPSPFAQHGGLSSGGRLPVIACRNLVVFGSRTSIHLHSIFDPRKLSLAIGAYRSEVASMYLDQDQNSDALPSSAGGFLLTRLLPRKSEETCVDTESNNTCEKSQLSGGKLMIAIIIVSIICGIAFLCFLFYLHRRRTKMERMEDLKDIQELDDYGIASAPPSSKAKPSRMPQAPAPTHAPTPMKHQTSDTRAGPPPPSYRESTDSLSPSIRQGTATVPRDGLSNH